MARFTRMHFKGQVIEQEDNTLLGDRKGGFQKFTSTFVACWQIVRQERVGEMAGGTCMVQLVMLMFCCRLSVVLKPARAENNS